MTYLKKYGLRFLYTFIIIIISLSITTALYYFNIINNGTYKILKITLVLLSIFINALILGKNAQQKGYLEGLKLSLIIPLFFVLTLITKQPLKLRLLLYYLIILITSIFGSMIGISKKKDN